MAEFDHSSEINHKGPRVGWLINSLCNFRCSYCYYTDDELASEHPDVAQYSPQDIANCFDSTGKSWWIHMSGGEPFLVPHFVKLCASLSENHFLTINTNCSTSNTLEFADTISPDRVYSINASIHMVEREKVDPGCKKFIEKALHFQKKGFQFRVEYVMHPSMVERLETDIEYLKTSGIDIVNLKAFKGYYKGKRYPQSYDKNEMALLNRYAHDPCEVAITKGPLSFDGKICSTGRDYITMDQSGNTFACNSSFVSLGNFFENSDVLLEQPRACVFKECKGKYDGLLFATEEKATVSNYAKEYIHEIPTRLLKKYSPKNVAKLLKRRVVRSSR